MTAAFGQAWKSFWEEEDGLGTLEILLIIAVLLIIAIAFRKWIMKWVGNLFDSANSEIENQSGTIKDDANTISP